MDQQEHMAAAGIIGRLAAAARIGAAGGRRPAAVAAGGGEDGLARALGLQILLLLWDWLRPWGDFMWPNEPGKVCGLRRMASNGKKENEVDIKKSSRRRIRPRAARWTSLVLRMTKWNLFSFLGLLPGLVGGRLLFGLMRRR